MGLSKSEKIIIDMMAYMHIKECLSVETETATSGETVFNLKKGKEFNSEACSVLFAHISTQCKQYTEMKIGRFWHIVWNFDNICIMFWDC